MRRRSASLLLLAFGLVAALATGGANASRTPVPDLVGVQPGAFSAIVRWEVPEGGRLVVEVGVDDRYGIWSPTAAVPKAAAGRTTLTGLEPATTYRFRILARWRSGLRGETRGSFRTDPWPSAVAASARAVTEGGPGPQSPFILPTPTAPGAPPGAPTGGPPSRRVRRRSSRPPRSA